MPITIETLDDWNKLLRCCCAMPSCPVPILECETKSGLASYDLYLPFAEPSVAASDDLPRLFETYESKDPIEYVVGEMVSKQVADSMPDPAPVFSSYTISTEDYRVSTASRTPTGWTSTDQSWLAIHEYIYPSWQTPLPPTGYTQCTTTESADSAGFFSEEPIDETDDCVRTETTEEEAHVFIYQSGGSRPTRQGCPGPHGSDSYVSWWDYRRYSQSLNNEVSDPKTKDDMISEAAAEAEADSWGTGICLSRVAFGSGIGWIRPRWPIKSDGYLGGSWRACGDGTAFIPVRCGADKSRFRLRVPVSHEGTWFRVSWDLVFFPADGGDPEVVALDQTAEWTGPGTGDQDDPSWLFPGEWREIPLPDRPGEVRIVNFRYECYRGPYGNLPQTVGEGYDIPSP